MARRRAYVACLTLFGLIKERTERLCDAHQVFVRTVILSLPSNWDLDVEDHYRDLIKQSLNPPRGVNIHFMTEIQANAHFIFNTRNVVTGHIKRRLKDNGQFQCLFADFGGLTFTPDLEACIRKRAESLQYGKLDPETLQRFEQEFDKRKLKGDFNDKTHRVQKFKVYCDEIDAHIYLQFTSEEIRDLRHRAHAGLLRLFEEEVDRLMCDYKPGTCVNISGGSTRDAEIRSTIITICVAQGLKEEDIIWTDDTCVSDL
ncbi:hypothetical protein N0V93_007897 [Gnomoniopsis smithogilvyi]|uniref:Uncharacterized protein n=1 Tax=Gnomoniopsis smithogilvyi TaxID=1191159 RepID=A0A9W8YN57_9PEZI|nr:hypothetical protein N0V93_007897 [Gnomoniopsis smithogilvyi]